MMRSIDFMFVFFNVLDIYIVYFGVFSKKKILFDFAYQNRTYQWIKWNGINVIKIKSKMSMPNPISIKYHEK